MLAVSTGSPYWFASRGAGTVSAVLLSATVVLGMAQTVRFRSTFWPRYLTIGLHRDLSLLTLVSSSSTSLRPFSTPSRNWGSGTPWYRSPPGTGRCGSVWEWWQRSSPWR
jgi:hypothetical protein